MLINVSRMTKDSRKGRAVFRAVADPTRRALLDLLLAQEQSVSELRVRFRMSQPAISQHLGVLRRTGLVTTRRDGRRRLYRLEAKPIEQVYRWARNYKAFFDVAGHAWVIRGVEETED